MSSNDTEEPMDCSECSEQPPTSHDNSAECSEQPPTSHDKSAECSEQPPTSHDKSAENKDEDQVTLSVLVKWPEGSPPQKRKIELEKALQTWANNSKCQQDWKVLNVSEDGRAVIKIKPAPAVRELQELSGKALDRKDGKKVTIMSVSLTPLETQRPGDASMDPPPSPVSEPQQEQLARKSSFGSSAAVSTEEEETFRVPVSHYWYVNHIYKEEIKRIERDNGVKMNAEVIVTFKADQKGGVPKNVQSEFINVVQKSLSESNGLVIPLKSQDPEELKDTLNVFLKKENKLLLTLSSEEMTVCGPIQSQAAISKSLNIPQKTSTNTKTSAGESTWASQDTSLNIGMNIEDPLINTGLTMEQNYWKLMTTSFDEHVAKIEAKFGVDFKESGIGQDKVKVKAHYQGSEGNASMESHAVRALLHLYQKIATSPMSFTQDHGAMGFRGSPINLSNVDQSEGASSGPVMNGVRNTEAPTEKGATAGGNEDDKCPICIDTFINKKQLKCKHEFCEECLAQAEKISGPICPVCKDVFGVVEGNQPKGRMSSYSRTSSLPGFPYSDTIVINYDIPGGRQTEKHPNPGEYYSGITRTAYLPGNKEGNEVLRLLKKAFDQKLIFTVGISRTTGMDNQVTWNDIHHKTSIHGGPQGFGYPDPDYLSRVREELKAKGVE